MCDRHPSLISARGLKSPDSSSKIPRRETFGECPPVIASKTPPVIASAAKQSIRNKLDSMDCHALQGKARNDNKKASFQKR
ncbi:hypothetical protein [Helicobacter canis]|uniref:hypothetical protein n=1 Tax=Helicobacter canis TaxID=29419 RepID=UPI0004075971|nr:hypothetical protein [Helicobacter canis]